MVHVFSMSVELILRGALCQVLGNLYAGQEEPRKQLDFIFLKMQYLCGKYFKDSAVIGVNTVETCLI